MYSWKSVVIIFIKKKVYKKDIKVIQYFHYHFPNKDNYKKRILRFVDCINLRNQHFNIIEIHKVIHCNNSNHKIRSQCPLICTRRKPLLKTLRSYYDYQLFILTISIIER